MSLSTKQNVFAVAIAKLILWCNEQGHVVTFGDAYRDPRLHGPMGTKQGYGEASSCHKVRLAVDLNLIKDGKLADAADYNVLHDKWDTLGGSKRIPKDLNHFSFEHEGHR